MPSAFLLRAERQGPPLLLRCSASTLAALLQASANWSTVLCKAELSFACRLARWVTSSKGCGP